MTKTIKRLGHSRFFAIGGTRFVSEYGVIGPCHLDSVKRYLKPEERHPDSREAMVSYGYLTQGLLYRQLSETL